MSNKYELTNTTIEVSCSGRGRCTLHRIRALRDFGDVKAGDLGGFIEKESNLSQENSCWVGGEAQVFEDAYVCAHGHVYGSAKVSGRAWVGEHAHVYGDAEVYSSKRHCIVKGDAQIYGNARVMCDCVCANARVFGNACVGGCDVVIGQDAVVSCIADYWSTTCLDYVALGAKCDVSGFRKIDCGATFYRTSTGIDVICGNQWIGKHFTLSNFEEHITEQFGGTPYEQAWQHLIAVAKMLIKVSEEDLKESVL